MHLHRALVSLVMFLDHTVFFPHNYLTGMGFLDLFQSSVIEKVTKVHRQ